MANFPTVPYSDLTNRVKALTGIDSFTTTDEAHIKEFANARARTAHERYPWPIFTVIGESVTLTGNTVRTYNIGSGSTQDEIDFDANVVFRIHKENPFTDDYPDEYPFAIGLTSSGDPCVNIINSTSLSGSSVFFTYRKDLSKAINETSSITTGKYGSASGDNPNIPHVYFSYIVAGTYADFLRSDGQTSKALAEDQVSESKLISEIDRISNQGRQFRHDILQYRPPSQFNRHRQTVGSGEAGSQSATLNNNVQ
jgi:hypothetical protein